MRRAMAIVIVLALGWGTARAEAREKSIRELPKDLWDIAFVWTEPIKQVVKHSRHSDPISGLGFGLLDGSMKSVERTTRFFLFQESEPTPESGKQLRYSF